MNELPGDLEAFLANPHGRPATAAFRARLCEETETLLPSRRAPRRVALPAAAAACGLALVGLAWWLGRPALRPVPQPFPPLVAIVDDARAPEAIDAPLSPALALEWQAFDSGSEERAELFWAAGQIYVATEGDYLSALRCYRQALDAGPVELREITDEDDVLAMVLKFDRSHKEKKHDTP